MQRQQTAPVRAGRMERLGNFCLWVSASLVVGGAAGMAFNLVLGRAYGIPMFFFGTVIAFAMLRER